MAGDALMEEAAEAPVMDEAVGWQSWRRLCVCVCVCVCVSVCV